MNLSVDTWDTGCGQVVLQLLVEFPAVGARRQSSDPHLPVVLEVAEAVGAFAHALHHHHGVEHGLPHAAAAPVAFATKALATSKTFGGGAAGALATPVLATPVLATATAIAAAAATTTATPVLTAFAAAAAATSPILTTFAVATTAAVVAPILTAAAAVAAATAAPVLATAAPAHSGRIFGRATKNCKKGPGTRPEGWQRFLQADPTSESKNMIKLEKQTARPRRSTDPSKRQTQFWQGLTCQRLVQQDRIRQQNAKAKNMAQRLLLQFCYATLFAES